MTGGRCGLTGAAGAWRNDRRSPAVEALHARDDRRHSRRSRATSDGVLTPDRLGSLRGSRLRWCHSIILCGVCGLLMGKISMAFLPSLLLKDITSPYQSVCLSDKFCLYICPSTSFFNSPHDFIFFPVTFVNKLEDPLNFCDSSCLAVAQRNVVEEL